MERGVRAGRGLWIAASVKDGEETAVAAKIVESLGFESYCPQHSRWRKLPRHLARKEGRTRVLVRDALIPGYVFARVSRTEDIADVFGLKHVFGFVCTSSGPCFARDEVIDELRRTEQSGEFDVKPKIRVERMRQQVARLEMKDYAGKTVRLTNGPFAGLVGEVKRVRGGELTLTCEAFEMVVSSSQIELVKG